MRQNHKKIPNPRKTIKIADLENFEIFVYAPCYKRLSISLPNYFIDTETNENVGQQIFLAKLPDGTLESPHYKVMIAELNQAFDVALEDFLDVNWDDQTE